MNQQTQTLLFEIHTEELPPKALKNMADFLANQSFESLKSEGFLSQNAVLETLATPRRMGFLIHQAHAFAADVMMDLRLPLKVGRRRKCVK
jgi:glycyl-tRNA synthetase beta chain